VFTTSAGVEQAEVENGGEFIENTTEIQGAAMLPLAMSQARGIPCLSKRLASVAV